MPEDITCWRLHDPQVRVEADRDEYNWDTEGTWVMPFSTHLNALYAAANRVRGLTRD